MAAGCLRCPRRFGALPDIVIRQTSWDSDVRMQKVKRRRAHIAKFDGPCDQLKKCNLGWFTRDKCLGAVWTCYLEACIFRIFLSILQNTFFSSLQRAVRDGKGWMATTLRCNMATSNRSESVESLPHLLATMHGFGPKSFMRFPRQQSTKNTSPFFLILAQAPSQNVLLSTWISCGWERRLDPNIGKRRCTNSWRIVRFWTLWAGHGHIFVNYIK
jgi:hypothetical protein